MASPHCYTITLNNNKTESEALVYLLGLNEGFVRPDPAGRRAVLKLFGLPETYYRTFDLLHINSASIENDVLKITDPTQITLIEVKSTKKKLLNHPAGFFFGATQNEFDLAEKAGDRLRFCFVCLHPHIRKHALLTLSELNGRIQTKRVQHQINLKR
jgi:hypothetical protein